MLKVKVITIRCTKLIHKTSHKRFKMCKFHVQRVNDTAIIRQGHQSTQMKALFSRNA